MNSKFQEQLIAWRHYLHQHPETAFEEKTAALLVAEEMRASGIDVVEGIGGTGVVVDGTSGDTYLCFGSSDSICGSTCAQGSSSVSRSSSALEPGSYHTPMRR